MARLVCQSLWELEFELREHLKRALDFKVFSSVEELATAINAEKSGV